MRSRVHPYIPNSVSHVKKRLMDEVGVSSVEELYVDVPEEYRLRRRLDLPEALSEFEVKRHVKDILSANVTCQDVPSFLGGGCWMHYVPAAVTEIVRRSELLTSYTPYQAEASQGMLQALFEFQSLVCEVTGMDVANCSLYDWASALGEAARMSARLTGRSTVLAPRLMHPERMAVLRTYVEPVGMRVESVDCNVDTGLLDLEDLKAKVSGETASVYVENPSYLGPVESQVDAIAEVAHEKEAFFVVGVDPTSLGVVKPPGEYGADIVVGEGQPFGNHMNFGGPLLGIYACRDDLRLIRQMPGRIIGMTVTADGDRGFCMALQTREQHIRREKATSNICSNEALCAVAAAVYLSLLGPEGLKELGEAILLRTSYAIKRLSEVPGVKTPLFDAPHFKEFTVNFDCAGVHVESVQAELFRRKVQGGKDISKEFPQFGQSALYCVSEVHSQADIDLLASALEEVVA